MKRFMVLGAILLAAAFVAAGTLLASATGARAAIECQPETVKGRSSHWSYRLIDGRKCWYEGKNKPAKSELFWPERNETAGAPIPLPENVRSTNAQAIPSPVEAEETNDPEDGSCCWPPQKPESQASGDSFEARWRSLGLRPQN